MLKTPIERVERKDLWGVTLAREPNDEKGPVMEITRGWNSKKGAQSMGGTERRSGQMGRRGGVGREWWFQKMLGGGYMCAWVRDHSCLTRMLKLKRPAIPRTGKDVKQTELSNFASGNIQPLWNTIW